MDFKTEMILINASDELYRSVEDLDSIGVSLQKIAGTIYRSLKKNNQKISELISELEKLNSQPFESIINEKIIPLPELPSISEQPNIVKSSSIPKVEETNDIIVAPFGDKYKIVKNNFVVDASFVFYGVAEGNNIRQFIEQEKNEALSLGLRLE